MVEQFRLNVGKDGRKLTKQIRDRVDFCYVPKCWTLKDPHDKGSIYLPKRFIAGSTSESIKKQRRVQIRHILFQIAYEEMIPIGRATRMRCRNSLCINPAHMTIAGGWQPSYESVRKMVKQNWVTEEQADEWYVSVPFTRKEKKQEPTEQELRDAQEARQYLNVLSPSQ